MHHSKAIDSAKSVVERIGNTHTSSQLIDLLDTLIFNALSPIIRDTKFVDSYIADLIVLSYGKKRKISSHPSLNVAYSRLAVYLLSKSTVEKKAALRAAKLDRGFLFLILDDFLSRVKPYKKLLVDCENSDGMHRFSLRSKLHKIEKSVRGSPDLLVTINQVIFWYGQAVEFKQTLAEKYLRHAVNNAVKLNSKHGFFNIELDDVVQNHALAVSKAIDKFDASKGTLTAYINNWFMDAKNSKNHHVTSPNTVSIDTDDYVEHEFDDSLDSDIHVSHSPCPTEELEKKELVENIRVLSKYADPIGYGRFSLGIEEHLTIEEKQKLFKVT